MARDFQVHGEVLVLVKFAPQVAGQYAWVSGQISASQFDPPVTAGENVSELGLASDSIKITPTFYHSDRQVDGFGRKAPAEVLCNLADCRISMSLVHYDGFVSEVCLSESMGGQWPSTSDAAGPALGGGTFGVNGLPGFVMPGAGRPLWAAKPITITPTDVTFLTGSHYMSLSLLPANGQQSVSDAIRPYRFPTAYLTQPPVVIPIGTKASLLQMEWRAVACPLLGGTQAKAAWGPTDEMTSKGAVLMDRGVLRSGSANDAGVNVLH